MLVRIVTPTHRYPPRQGPPVPCACGCVLTECGHSPASYTAALPCASPHVYCAEEKQRGSGCCSKKPCAGVGVDRRTLSAWRWVRRPSPSSLPRPRLAGPARPRCPCLCRPGMAAAPALPVRLSCSASPVRLPVRGSGRRHRVAVRVWSQLRVAAAPPAGGAPLRCHLCLSGRGRARRRPARHWPLSDPFAPLAADLERM